MPYSPLTLSRTVLKPGPVLIAVYRDPSSGRETTQDVTSNCIAFLLEPVVCERPTLRDLLTLLKANPVVIDVLGRNANYVRQCLERCNMQNQNEAILPPNAQMVLHRQTGINTGLNSMTGPTDFQLFADYPGRAQGECAISVLGLFTEDLLETPIRFDLDMSIVECDMESENWDQVIHHIHTQNPLLLEFISGVFQALASGVKENIG